MKRNKQEKIKNLVVYPRAREKKRFCLEKTIYPIIILTSLLQIFSFGMIPKIWYAPEIREVDENNLFSDNEVVISEDEQRDILGELEKTLGIRIEDNQENYLLLHAVSENPYLNRKEKEIFYKFIEYFNDNPYINREDIYQNILNVNARFALRQSLHEEENVLAVYLPDYRDIVYFHLFPSIGTIAHEDGHSIEAKNLPRWLAEGMLELIVSEYFSEVPFLLTDIYPYEVSLVKFVCELIGTDKVLQAYTEGKVEIIYEKMDEMIGEEISEKVLGNVDWWLQNRHRKEFLTEEELQAVKYSLEKLLDYLEPEEYQTNHSYQYHLGVVISCYTDEFGSLNEWKNLTYCKSYLSSYLKQNGFEEGIMVKTSEYVGSVYQK